MIVNLTYLKEAEPEIDFLTGSRIFYRVNKIETFRNSTWASTFLKLLTYSSMTSNIPKIDLRIENEKDIQGDAHIFMIVMSRENGIWRIIKTNTEIPPPTKKPHSIKYLRLHEQKLVKSDGLYCRDQIFFYLN